MRRAAATHAAHVATPSRLLFHEFSDGAGYFEEAPLTVRGPATRLFWHFGEPWDATATKHLVIWINEPPRFNRTALLASAYDGLHKRTLVHRVGGNANGLVVAGQFVYWADLFGIGRVRLDGTRIDRHFIRLPLDIGRDSAAAIATNGRFLYIAECAGRIGQVPLSKSRSLNAIDWLINEPRHHRPLFCPQNLAVSGNNLYYGHGHWIGRISLTGRHRQDDWRSARQVGLSDSLLATRWHLYWDTCGGPQCSDSHIDRMTINGHHLRGHLYAHIDQGLTLAP